MAGAIYRGMFFPFKKGSTALPEPVYDGELVKQSLQQIVLTGRNERVMRPDFGCDAYSFIHENNNDLLAELIRTEVYASVGRFEPRVILQDVLVVRDTDKGLVDITLVYVLVATRQQDTVEIVLPMK